MGQKTLLVIGHPGHELRVWHWLCQEKPAVCILTDGSGGTGDPRLAATQRLLELAGASHDAGFGCVTDAQIYKATLEHDLAFFVQIATKIRDLLISEQFDIIVGDGLEGYNPTHDLCRLMIDAAVTAASRRGRQVLNYSFPLMGHPHGAGQTVDDVCVELTQAQLQQKIDLIVGYGTQAGGMLATEVADTFARFGTDAFIQEWLFLTSRPITKPGHGTVKPFYERHGEQRVAEGAYKYVIRYNEHVFPVLQELTRWADEELGGTEGLP